MTHVPEPRWHTDNELHVVTVYFGNSPLNSLWLHLQQEFLRRTTLNYRFSVYLNSCDQSLFEDVEVLGIAPSTGLPPHPSANHLWCLQELSKLVDRSKSLLVLDSDCFPIQEGWQFTLQDAMADRGFQAAAPIRVENLDLFPHPCAMFVTSQGMRDFEFVPSNSDNLLGVRRQEPTCSTTVFPLIRTNRINIHPIGAAVYYDMFYHHGAGSRPALFHNIDTDPYFTGNYDWEHSINRLKQDPAGFINWLMQKE